MVRVFHYNGMVNQELKKNSTRKSDRVLSQNEILLFYNFYRQYTFFDKIKIRQYNITIHNARSYIKNLINDF